MQFYKMKVTAEDICFDFAEQSLVHIFGNLCRPTTEILKETFQYLIEKYIS